MARTQVSACKFQDEQDLYAENGFNHFFLYLQSQHTISAKGSTGFRYKAWNEFTILKEEESSFNDFKCSHHTETPKQTNWKREKVAVQVYCFLFEIIEFIFIGQFTEPKCGLNQNDLLYACHDEKSLNKSHRIT